VHDAAKPEDVAKTLTPSVTPNEITKVGFVGLGAMGIGMAVSLVKAGFKVAGYDVYPPSTEKFVATGGSASAAQSPAEAALDAQILILMVQNASQAEDVLFGAGKAAETLPNGAVVILNSTVPPSFVRGLRTRLVDLGRNIDLIDAPVSGGVARAALGQLTVSLHNDHFALRF
jgi:3-hydroxyisobutyrate dehydrogenase-like beta-hydroxyacid dehydrogenase